MRDENSKRAALTLVKPNSQCFVIHNKICIYIIEGETKETEGDPNLKERRASGGEVNRSINYTLFLDVAVERFVFRREEIYGKYKIYVSKYSSIIVTSDSYVAKLREAP